MNTTEKGIAVNLNQSVKVKLHSIGLWHWKVKDDAVLANAPHLKKPFSDYQSRCDADGYVTMQLWEFMRTFGDTIEFGGSQVFDLDIIILP